MNPETAEKQIASILQQLETTTGSIVKCIDIVDINTTAIGDDRMQFRRRVQIELERLPGTNWAK